MSAIRLAATALLASAALLPARSESTEVVTSAPGVVVDPRSGARMQWPPTTSGQVALASQGWEGLVDVAEAVPKREMSAAEGRWRYQRMESQVARGGGAVAWYTANYYFAQTGNLDCARSLMEFGVVPSVRRAGLARQDFPLHAAAMRDDADAVARLVDDDKHDVDARAADDTTPLVVAAAANATAAVAALLDRGADVHASGHNGMTPAHVAAAQGFVAVLDLLRTRDVDLDLKHKFAGSAPIHFAAEMGQVEAVIWLCRNGADVDADKVQGGGALHIAAELNQTEVVRALVSRECRASTETRLLNDTTPVYLAAQNGNVEAVRLLLDAGADGGFEMPVGETRTDVVPLGSPLTGSGGGGAGHPFFDDPSAPGGGALVAGAAGEPGEGEASLHNFGFEAGNGATALHAAVENGHEEVVRVLLSRGTPQTASMEGAVPVYVAAEYGRCPGIMRRLVEAPGGRATLTAVAPRGGAFPLYIAAQRGREACVAELLRAGAPVEQRSAGAGATALFVAAVSGQEGAARLLLAAGANASARTGPPDSATPLHAAAERGSVGMVELLLGAGADAGAASGRDAQTPLHMALGSGRRGAAAAAALVRGGADVDARVASTRATPLMMAARHRLGGVASLLVRAGARVDARAGKALHRATALYMAATAGSEDIVAGLLGAGAAPDPVLAGGTGVGGITPLMAAADRGDTRVMRLLVRGGAKVGRVDGAGRTALHLAAMSGKAQAAKLLLAAGAPADARRDGGGTPLLDAVMSGYNEDGSVSGAKERRGAHAAPPKRLRDGALEVARALLEAGADRAAANGKGETPLLVAQRLREFEFIRLLQASDEL